VNFTEMVDFVIEHPCIVVFCKPSEEHKIYPKGKEFTPYMTLNHDGYWSEWSKCQNDFVYTNVGTLQQPAYCRSMQDWENRIRRAAKMGAITDISKQSIERHFLKVTGADHSTQILLHDTPPAL
jgi:hypothetical protein